MLLTVCLIIFRNRVNKFDPESAGVSIFLNKVDGLVLARLAYASRSYHRALLYLERSYDEMKTSNVGLAAQDDFVQTHLDLMMRIYAGLGEPDSVKGCERLRAATLPSLEEMFHSATAERDSLNELMLGAKLLRHDHR